MSAGTPQGSHPQADHKVSGPTSIAPETTELMAVRRRRSFFLVALLICLVWIDFAEALRSQSTEWRYPNCIARGDHTVTPKVTTRNAASNVRKGLGYRAAMVY